MSKKVIILVDGQNLYYSLRDMSLLERDVKWDMLFKSILEQDDELARTYWFRPERIHDSYYTYANIKNTIIAKQFPTYKGKEWSSIPYNIISQVDSSVTEAQRWLRTEKERFASIQHSYDQLPLEFGDIEFVKTGHIRVNPYKQEYGGEKGVDIALAVKMVGMSAAKKCDKIILFSGDFDYAEAIKYAKNEMVKVHIVKMHQGEPPQNRSMSKELSVLADKVIDVYESVIKSKFLKPPHP